ncbi:MAG TPA: diguanylate cyclase, partial [Nitrospirota bacterium]|nr:diguanylate cyclase [Nitrospirota bacterium]
MKRKVILSLLALFLFSATGAVIATLYIRNTTSTLGKLIELHQISEMRQHMIISIQTVQSELYTVGTDLGHDIDVITDHVIRLEDEAQKCTNCHQHHTPDVVTTIGLIQTDIRQYQSAVSNYITASADRSRITRLKLDAAEIGNRLLARTEKMSIESAKKLETTTENVMAKIGKVQIILYITLAISFMVGIIIAARLTTSITRPIETLVNATREIAQGNLGHTIPIRDRTEFGELSGHFNTMSGALREGYTKLEQEIAERTSAQNALATSEAFLNRIFDSIRDPFCIFDCSLRIIRANDAYAELKRKSIEGLLGQPCYRVLENRDTVCPDCTVEKSFITKDACAKEKKVATPEGAPIWLAVYTYPILGTGGEISHVIEYVQDITPRKLAEEALRESEERYALAARGANDGLWDWDLKRSRIYYSYRWKSMLGYGDREISNSPDEWLDRIHPDEQQLVRARITSHLNGQSQSFESEHRIRHKDGTYRWMLSRGLAVRDSRGNAHRMAGSQTDITLRKNAEEQLLHDAFHDALTGLPNRALFQDRLQHVLLSSRRHVSILYAVLFFDLDRFKVVNDSLGHNVGDTLLVEVGKRLALCLRPGDTVARLGGDEFAVLLEDIRDKTDAADVAERVQQDLAVPFFIQGSEVMISASIGIALKSDRYVSPDQILRDADIAMYQAKAKGKARYEFFDSAMHANVLDRIQLEADLRIAVGHRNGFVMHYQPILKLKHHTLTGFEALVRWQHPTRGLIAPLQFIPLAEETGLIIPLSEWTLETSCRQLREWQALYPSDPPLKMSINVSSRHFLYQGFADK